jgi:coenzyme F420 hydrogenase subunit beta
MSDSQRGTKFLGISGSGGEKETAKTFKDLIQQVHEPGICGQCGGCVSFCYAGDLVAIEMTAEGKPNYIDEENCLQCGICFLICPQINLLDEEIQAEYNWEPPIGSFKHIVSGRTTYDEVKKVCSDGGAVTSLLLYLLEQKLIDGAIVSVSDGPFGRKPIVATTKEKIISAAGSRFIGKSNIEELGNFTTYSQTMFALRDIKNLDMLKIAVVGTPCQIHTIRKMQYLGVMPAHVVKYVIGLFCLENFSFSIDKLDEVEEVLGMKITDIKKINLKEDFIITTNDDKIKHIPLSELEKVARPACFACTDYANDYADISVGGIGSPDGYSTIVIRNEVGQKIYSNALRHKYIEELNVGNELDLGSGLINYEKGICLSSKARKDLLLKYARIKRKRGLETLEKLRKAKTFPERIAEDINIEVQDEREDKTLEQTSNDKSNEMSVVNIEPSEFNTKN